MAGGVKIKVFILFSPRLVVSLHFINRKNNKEYKEYEQNYPYW